MNDEIQFFVYDISCIEVLTTGWKLKVIDFYLKDQANRNSPKDRFRKNRGTEKKIPEKIKGSKVSLVNELPPSPPAPAGIEEEPNDPP